MALPIPESYELILEFIGQHRSERLALRHLRELERQYPLPEFVCRIAGRRNAQGEFSERGHFFTFQVWQKQEEEEEIEYEGAFDSP